MNPARLLLAVALFVSIATPLVAQKAPRKQIVIGMSVVEVPRADDGETKDQRAETVRRVIGEVAMIRTLLTQLSKHDDAKTLSSPTMVTTSGREASLHSGGELLVPVLQPNGRWTNETREFGTIVSLTPKSSTDEVMLDFDARFVEPDLDNAITVDGVRVPGLSIRSVQTKVTLSRGQAVLLIAEHTDATRMILVHPEEVVAPPAK